MQASAVLLIEDDASLREALCDTLELAGYAVAAAQDGDAALEMLDRMNAGLVVCDVQLPRMDGHALLKRIKALRPELPVVLMTAYGTIQKAVAAMRDGAVDYLVKPFEAEVLITLVGRFFASVEPGSDELVACDASTRALADLARRVAGSDVTVLLNGESGTGKEVFARFIHRHSARAAGPFMAINCAAIPENMLEAVLFGYEKGAFTGAYQARPGKFEQAQGGTLLLDEISEMDLSLQAKLLRVLQEREVERLGGSKSISLNVRVLATTNRDLRQAVTAGRFREDLFYRLNVFPMNLPPLRERRADILPLARRSLERHCNGTRPVPAFAAGAEANLLAHAWPGNVRELDNVIQRALVLARGDQITSDDLRFEPVTGAPEAAAPARDGAANLEADLKTRELWLIAEALRAGNGSRKLAAERLGISPRTLRYKLARLREAGVDLPGKLGAESA